MKNSTACLVLVSALFVSLFSNAQNGTWCSTMDRVKKQVNSNPQIALDYEKMEIFLRDAQNSAANRGTDVNAQTIFIPVVFHIVHNGDAVGSGENISDAQCLSQLEATNLHYQALDVNLVNIPAAFAGKVGNCNLQFCLAKFDPDGNPTTGIIRHQMSNASWDDDNTIDNTLKPATIWDNKKYLNIWSVRMGGTLSSSGVLAYATLPFFGSDDQDGIVSRHNAIGTIGSLVANHNLGKTITHEIGHWLGLLHIWGNDDACGDAGDYVADTPDQGDLNFGCPTFPHVSCNNGPDGDMFMNYMDYTDDACSYMFSKGQADNTRTIIDQFRAEIKTASSTCFYSLDASVAAIRFPQDSICTYTFSPVVTLKNEGLTTLTSGKFYYQLDGDVVQIFNWTGSVPVQGEVQVTLSQQQVFASGIHTLDITFGNVNGQPADNFSGNDNKSISFYATNGSAAVGLPFAEDFESTFPAANWSVFNPNNDIAAWTKSTSFGGYGTSASSIYIDNTVYASNPNKKKDAVITGAYDFTTLTQPEMKFDVAYAQYSTQRSDSLNVYYSRDCGSNWIKIWNQSGSQLATAPVQTDLFLPTASQWKTVSIPLLNLVGQNNVSFKFENVTGWGNAMYLDNINVQNNAALSVAAIEKADIKVFPNPASNMAAVRLPQSHTFKQLQIVNNVGQVVYETSITDQAVVFSVADLASGIYLLRFIGAEASQVEKMLIAR
ncbi:MAG TPA: M43 family zinc metalloprotease [Chitinophagales bacterium]|nr:M43 family zinc metalloprotease [Chitinophagales bacterium]